MTELELRACDMRIDIVRMIAEAGSGHPGGSLSCTDILTALYFGGVMDHNPEDPKWEGRDRFILAKGHAAPALYAVLAHAGYFPREELSTLRKLGTRLQGHPDCNLCPGVEVSTGSLGQGLSIAAGAAAGLKLAGKPQRVFCLLVANTIKGKGVSFMENQAGWHGKAPNAEQTEQAVAELEAAKKEA